MKKPGPFYFSMMNAGQTRGQIIGAWRGVASRATPNSRGQPANKARTQEDSDLERVPIAWLSRVLQHAGFE
jgi:hypothetical protein